LGSGELYSVEDFWRFDMRVCLVKSAEKISGSKKLIKLVVDLGKEERTIVAGIGDQYTPEELVGKKLIVLTNIKPKKIFGVESQGMLVVAEDENKRVYLVQVPDAPIGSRVY